MVQFVLIFALGFFVAAFAAVALAPAIWRRAVVLTRRRIEASMPLTRNELQADKDQQRAEFALALRKVEMVLKAKGEQLTSTQADLARLQLDNSAKQVEISSLSLKLADTEQTVSDLEQALATSRAEVSSQEVARTGLQAQIKAAETRDTEKDAALNALKIELDTSRLTAAAKDMELQREAASVSEAKAGLADANQELRSLANQLRSAKEELRTDKRKLVEAEKTIDRLTAQFSDRKLRLERREEEGERLKEQVKVLTGENNDLVRKLASSERKRAHLESRNEKFMAQKSGLGLITVDEGTSNDALREKIQEIAAQLVAKTAAEEGDKSPIREILIPAGKGASSGGPKQDLPLSLADRIRMLEQAARRN